VLSEALRVLQSHDICSDNGRMSGAVLWELGKLINESHDSSCSINYDSSCPILDELARIYRDAGAYGSRLTGKFTVFLVAEDKVFNLLISCEGHMGLLRS
jgi:galactokinase